MLERLSGDGQSVCCMCNIEKGFHREWTTSIFHVINTKGMPLRFYGDSPYSHTVFSNDDSKKCVTLCYKHALMVEDHRKNLTDY